MKNGFGTMQCVTDTIFLFTFATVNGRSHHVEHSRATLTRSPGSNMYCLTEVIYSDILTLDSATIVSI